MRPCRRWCRDRTTQTRTVGFGNPPLPQDRRVPLWRFMGSGGLGFDEVIAALSVEGAPAVPVIAEGHQRTIRGYATEVDSSQIIRVMKTKDPTSGVIALVTRTEGALFGEFVER